jgi:hypothetical protein
MRSNGGWIVLVLLLGFLLADSLANSVRSTEDEHLFRERKRKLGPAIVNLPR